MTANPYGPPARHQPVPPYAPSPTPFPGDARFFAPGPYAPAPTPTRAGKARIAVGGALLGIGLVATVVTYLLAPPGGTFVIAFGPMVFGLAVLIRGLVAYGSSR